jgi:hypothetical protein
MTSSRRFSLAGLMTVVLVALGLMLSSPAAAAVLFFDTFNTGVRPEWRNESGQWIANGGVYYPATGPYGHTSTVGGLSLTDFVVDVDINNVASAGVWLRYSGSSGVLLSGRQAPESDIYWHIVSNGSFSAPINRVVWDRGNTNVHLRITVEGNVYKVFVNGLTTPITTLTTSAFASGTVGLFNNGAIGGVQTFDNFQVSTLSSPPHITSISPTSGPIGTLVTITGSNFGAAQGSSSVTFDSTEATVSFWSDTEIEVAIPALPDGSYDVVVTTSTGSSNPVSFEVQLPIICELVIPSLVIDPSMIVTGGIGVIAGATGNGPIIVALFTPNFCLSLRDAANLLGYHHFNWVSVITEDSSLDLLSEELLNGLRDQNGNLPEVPYFDPPEGGYEYQRHLLGGILERLPVRPFPVQDSKKWYLDEEFTIHFNRVTPGSGLKTGLDELSFDRDGDGVADMLEFRDSPSRPRPFNVKFLTALVGVFEGGGGAIIPGTSFEWEYVPGEEGGILLNALNPGMVTKGSARLLGFIDPSNFTPEVLNLLAREGIGIRNQPPVAVCQNVTVPTGPGICSAASASVNNGSSDPDGDQIFLVQSPVGPYSLGTTAVTLTVTDSKGASASCSATVTVIDQTPPAITCPSNQTAECTGPNGAAVSFSATATDNCTASPTIGCNPPAGALFALGTTTDTCTATDAATNQNTCSFAVTVVDTTPPSLSARWVPLKVEKDEGTFRLEFSVTDVCHATPQVTGVVRTPALGGLKIELKTKAEVKVEFDGKEKKVKIQGPNPQALLAQLQQFGGLVVTRGQVVKVELKEANSGKQEFKFEKDGTLKIEAPSATLQVTGKDGAGNTATLQAKPQFATGDDDDDDEDDDD